jgi:uncharacterized membrane protein YcaP (DUF421 family)
VPYFESWSSIGHTLAIGVVAYCAVVLFLRISGKRTLSKLNAFDFVVTVALGSTLATVVVSRQVPLADGLIALSLLVLLQAVVTFAMTRSTVFLRIVKSQPALLFDRGSFVSPALRHHRVAREEVLAAIRGTGVSDLSSVHAVVLETDGSLSVLREPPSNAARSTLANVDGAERAAASRVRA